MLKWIPLFVLAAVVLVGVFAWHQLQQQIQQPPAGSPLADTLAQLVRAWKQGAGAGAGTVNTVDPDAVLTPTRF